MSDMEEPESDHFDPTNIIKKQKGCLQKRHLNHEGKGYVDLKIEKMEWLEENMHLTRYDKNGTCHHMYIVKIDKTPLGIIERIVIIHNTRIGVFKVGDMNVLQKIAKEIAGFRKKEEFKRKISKIQKEMKKRNPDEERIKKWRDDLKKAAFHVCFNVYDKSVTEEQGHRLGKYQIDENTGGEYDFFPLKNAELWIRMGRLKVRQYSVCFHRDVSMFVAKETAKDFTTFGSYSLFKNNCEHFATFVKTGITDSRQIKNATIGLFVGVAAVMGLSFGGTAFLSVIAFALSLPGIGLAAALTGGTVFIGATALKVTAVVGLTGVAPVALGAAISFGTATLVFGGSFLVVSAITGAMIVGHQVKLQKKREEAMKKFGDLCSKLCKHNFEKTRLGRDLKKEMNNLMFGLFVKKLKSKKNYEFEQYVFEHIERKEGNERRISQITQKRDGTCEITHLKGDFFILNHKVFRVKYEQNSGVFDKGEYLYIFDEEEFRYVEVYVNIWQKKVEKLVGKKLHKTDDVMKEIRTYSGKEFRKFNESAYQIGKDEFWVFVATEKDANGKYLYGGGWIKVKVKVKRGNLESAVKCYYRVPVETLELDIRNLEEVIKEWNEKIRKL